MVVLLKEPLPEDLLQLSAPPPPPPPSADELKFNSLKIVLKKLSMEEYSERLTNGNVRRASAAQCGVSPRLSMPHQVRPRHRAAA